MNTSEFLTEQRRKESQTLKTFLVCSLVGSLGLHAGAMTTRVEYFGAASHGNDEPENELIVEAAPLEEPPPKLAIAEPPPEPEIQDIALTSDIAPPPLPPLAPDALLPPGEDAPSNKPPTPTANPVPVMTGNTPTTTETVQTSGGGPITSLNGLGRGFGFGKLPTGFNPFGQSGGSPQGKPGGVPGGIPGGVPGGRGTQPVRTTPTGTPQLACLECPKPKFRGTEGQPKVTYDIAPDGRVTNVRLRKSSGNPEIDRETLETMQKWRFKPETVPEGGRRNVKVRVTFEEDGSRFQRENERRRRQETEQRQAAEQEQRRRAAEVPIPVAAPTTATSAPSPQKPAAETSLPVEAAPAASPVEAPTPVKAPTPVEAPPPSPVEAPVEAPPPVPVEPPAPANPPAAVP